MSEIPLNGEVKKIMTLRFLQGRNPDWVARPFFANYDERALWFDDLKPAFEEKEFFFEKELRQIYLEDEVHQYSRAIIFMLSNFYPLINTSTDQDHALK